jgi:hypothetical protein
MASPSKSGSSVESTRLVPLSFGFQSLLVIAGVSLLFLANPTALAGFPVFGRRPPAWVCFSSPG